MSGRFVSAFSGVPRDVLERDLAQAYANLTSVQTICTAQLNELRELRAGINLPGWDCASCGLFNGEKKERRETCRGCEARRPA